MRQRLRIDRRFGLTAAVATRQIGLAAAMCLVASVAAAGEFNAVLSVGDPAPVWTDLPGVDDKRHSLADLKDKPVVVVVFTCNSCGYAVDHEERLVAFHHQFEPQGVALVAINVNRIPEDRLDAMKTRAEERGFRFAYLYDESQQIARDYGADRTPQFFVLDRDRRITYMGSMDDSPDGSNVRQKYLEDAVTATLAGKQPPKTETVPIGCAVRYQRQRK